LADSHQNEWINQVNQSWSGAIPAILFLTSQVYNFHEGEINYQELIKLNNKYKL